jgi:hypothetical protein
MAKDDKNPAGKPAGTPPGPVTDDIESVPTTVEIPAEAIHCNTNRLIYKPELCSKWPLKGIMVSYQNMPAVGEGEDARNWDVYVLKLTQASVGVDRQGALHVAKVGDEIMLVEVYTLQNEPRLRGLAENPKWTAEVILRAIDKVGIGGGKKMWQYDVHIIPKSIPRTGSLALLSTAKPAQLAPGNGASSSLATAPTAEVVEIAPPF